jgi:hypothetical protein
VTVNTTGGSPTLTLNDGGTATYTGGSTSSALTFSYTVAAGQNTPDLIVSAFNLNGATVKDGAGNVANLSGATNNNPAGTLQISTTATGISSRSARNAPPVPAAARQSCFPEHQTARQTESATRTSWIARPPGPL